MQNGTIFEKSQNIFLKRGGVMAYLSDDELLDTEGGFTGWDNGTGTGAAEETLEKEQLAAEKRLQEQIEAEAVSRALDQDQKTNDQQNAINMENQGNELLAQGSYESAITFYRVAQASYKQLGLTELADGIDKKMEAAQAGIAAKEAQAAEAEKQKSE